MNSTNLNAVPIGPADAIRPHAVSYSTLSQGPTVTGMATPSLESARNGGGRSLATLTGGRCVRTSVIVGLRWRAHTSGVRPSNHGCEDNARGLAARHRVAPLSRQLGDRAVFDAHQHVDAAELRDGGVRRGLGVLGWVISSFTASRPPTQCPAAADDPDIAMRPLKNTGPGIHVRPASRQRRCQPGPSPRSERSFMPCTIDPESTEQPVRSVRAPAS